MPDKRKSGQGGYYDNDYLDTHIHNMTKKFINAQGSRIGWSKLGFTKEPSAKVRPFICEHCDCIMTVTGRTPAIADIQSWYHWIGWTTEREGLKKVHHLSSVGQNTYGTCTSCEELHNSPEWLEDGEE